jgi:hypothetical protein
MGDSYATLYGEGGGGVGVGRAAYSGEYGQSDDS